MYFKGKNNISFLAGVVSENILYYSSYNFGGIWKLDLNVGKSEMLAYLPDNRKHEFAFKIYDEIWFAPAYHEKNIFDVYNIKNKTINCISVRPTKNNEKRYSNYIETNNEIWIMPAMVDYIIVIDKISKNIEYINLSNFGLKDREFYFINSIKIGDTIYLYETKKSHLICIDIGTKKVHTEILGRIETEYRNVFNFDKYLYILPKNINGNSIVKFDTEQKKIVNEYKIFDDPSVGKLICSGCKVIGNIAYIAPFNFNKIIKWSIEGNLETIKIESLNGSNNQQLCYWEAIDIKNGFVFGIETEGAPLFILEDKGRSRILEIIVDELKDGLLRIL